MVFSGALLPLWFMPPAIADFIALTPFKSIYFVPISIYLGSGADGRNTFKYSDAAGLGSRIVHRRTGIVECSPKKISHTGRVIYGKHQKVGIFRPHNFIFQVLKAESEIIDAV
jgi:hypothetical protein